MVGVCWTLGCHGGGGAEWRIYVLGGGRGWAAGAAVVGESGSNTMVRGRTAPVCGPVGGLGPRRGWVSGGVISPLGGGGWVRDAYGSLSALY